MYSGKETITAKLEHQYLTNCPVVLSVVGYYTFFTLAFLAMVLWWGNSIYRVYPMDSTALQKGLFILPILKLVCVFIYGSYVNQCPWPNQI